MELYRLTNYRYFLNFPPTFLQEFCQNKVLTSSIKRHELPFSPIKGFFVSPDIRELPFYPFPNHKLQASKKDS